MSKTSSKEELIVRKVTLTGIGPIMFDRYAGDNSTQLRPDQKLYLVDRNIVLPSLNIMSLLSAQNTESAPKRFHGKKYKSIAQAVLSYVQIEPFEIAFLRDGKPIAFGGFSGNEDATSGVYLRKDVARLAKGIPNPKERPVLPPPWSLEFILRIWPNKEVNEATVQNLLIQSGMAIGLGTFRGVFGKFKVSGWEAMAS